MPRRTLTRDADQRAELEHTRDHDRRPYFREYASAWLKIAAGQSPRQVALHGLHQPRHPRTVRRWLTKYEAGGLTALTQQPQGHRGFSPSVAERITQVIRQEPQLHGLARSRWRRRDVQEVIPELAHSSLSGIGKLLSGWGCASNGDGCGCIVPTRHTTPKWPRSPAPWGWPGRTRNG